MPAKATARPDCTVDLLGDTYQVDLGNDLQRAIAAASDDLDSARDRLDAALTQVRNDAQHALDQLHAGRSVNPLGPIQSEYLVASCAAEYHLVAAHARALLRLSGLQPSANDTDPSRGQSDAT